MNKTNLESMEKHPIAEEFNRFMGDHTSSNNGNVGGFQKFSLYDYSQYETRTSTCIVNPNIL